MFNVFNEPRLGNLTYASDCAQIVYDCVEKTTWMLKNHSLEQFLEMMVGGFPIREFWVIGKPIMGYLSFNAEVMQVVGLYVNPTSKGLGKAPLDKVKMGRASICLWSHLPNSNAHRSYLREGFIQTNIQENGNDGLPEVKFQCHA